MFNKPRYIQSSFSIIFPRDALIRRRVNDFEDALKTKFFQPQIINVPDDLEPEIPRILFRSKYNQILISQTSFAMTTVFSTDWQTDIDKAQRYVVKHAPRLFNLLNVLNTNACFCGMTTEAHLSSQAKTQEIASLLSNKLLRDPSITNPYDITIKTTEVVAQRFFSNISIENYRVWGDIVDRVIPSPEANAIDHGIRVVSDFNDRYAFNEVKQYHSSKEVANTIIEEGFKSVRTAVERIMEAAT